MGKDLKKHYSNFFSICAAEASTETLLQRRNTDGQQAHEKMLNTDNY